ncbi:MULTISPECIES: AraC family transcriptional regulator [Caproicibacterium]|jgi:AraC family transcriptional regulator of arabinose operon|nr:AraC family transcriptional regulator [Caproicibacterium lactatifermentans]MDD4808253.1 AraC family transcriptional regulator [Oscillospiraceae bacterium]
MQDTTETQPSTTLSNEFSLLFCGERACPPGHAAGPAIREYYLMYYCLSGHGIFQTKNCSFSPGPQDGFLIFPQEVTFHEADLQDPWHYIWVAFRGSNAEQYLTRCGLSRQQRTFHCGKSAALQDCVTQMMQHMKLSDCNEFFLQSLLYRWFGILASAVASPNHSKKASESIYVKKAIEFLQKNYQNDITIAKVADYVCLNRSYLTSLFRRQLHTSPREYLVNLRISHAADLLRHSDLPVSHIACSCGYPDPLAFSRAFHRLKGISPTEYRTACRAGKAAAPQQK